MVAVDVSPFMFTGISLLSDGVVLAENDTFVAFDVAGLSTLAPAVVFGVDVIDKDATTKHKPTNTV